MLQFEENDQATRVNGNTFIPKPNIVRIDYNKVYLKHIIVKATGFD